MKSRIDKDIRTALKSGDTSRRDVLRMLKSDIINSEIAAGSELDDDGVIGLVAKGVKTRRESVKLYERGGRQDLVDKESREIDVLLKYLPEQMSEDEIREKVRTVIEKLGSPGMKEMGQVMKSVMAEIGKQADGSVVSKIVKELLQVGS
jgi:hypothetical protein